MTSKESVDQFFNAANIAVIGVSGSGKKFGAAVYRELKKKGVHVFGINAKGGAIDGDALHASLRAVPVKPDAAVIVVPPKASEEIVREAHALGIKNIWLQPGAESEAAIEFCESSGLNVIHGECILMHAAPVGSIHKVHRFINKVFGTLPK